MAFNIDAVSRISVKEPFEACSFHLPQTAKDSHYIVDPIKKQLNKNHREIGSSSLCSW